MATTVPIAQIHNEPVIAAVSMPTEPAGIAARAGVAFASAPLLECSFRIYCLGWLALTTWRLSMFRDVILWAAGVPIVIIVVLHLFGVLHY